MPLYKRQSGTIESHVEDHANAGYRHVLRFIPKSPFIKARDRTNNSAVSLKPLRKDVLTDVQTAIELCQYVDNSAWDKNSSVEILLHKKEKGDAPPEGSLIYNWENLIEVVFNHLTKNMKGSSAKNVKSHINNLAAAETPLEWRRIKAWLFEKDLHSRPFRNRLDSLEQLRLAIQNKEGSEPLWLQKSNLVDLRQQHNKSSAKAVRYQPQNSNSKIRGIPTKKEAENYFDQNIEENPLEIWCLAMMMLYGLRNHELHHISPITKDNPEEDMVAGWVYVPGEWRTKSKYEHWTFPIFPDWIEKYKLSENFQVMQELLHTKAKPKIVSAIDKTKPWDKENENDLGVCDNNSYLGNFITYRLREVLDPWHASVPDARGVHLKRSKKQVIVPYDLRHTWAVTVATSSNWNHVSDVDAAACMGHDIEVHRRNYQKWISVDETRKTFMRKITLR